MKRDNPLFVYQAQLLKVIDGDTLRLLIDKGMRDRSEESIRLLNIDTPELFSGDARDQGAAARQFVVDWCMVHQHANPWPLRIYTEKDRTTFNRYLAQVLCATCGSDLVEKLKAAGY